MTSPVVERDVINPVFGAYDRDRGQPPANSSSFADLFPGTRGSQPLPDGRSQSSGDHEAVKQAAGGLKEHSLNWE